MTSPGNQPPQTRQGLKPDLLLYALSFGLALALRLHAIGRWPLLDGEAGLAWAAWRFARSLPADLRGHSPLLFNLNAALLYFTNGSDALVRLASVLFGAFMVLWPYGLRARLGRVGALATSFLIALSPSYTYFSRTADGSIVVAFCALGLWAAAEGYLRERGPQYVYSVAVLLILALLAAPLTYTLLAMIAVLGLWVWLQSRRQPGLEKWAELRQAWQDLWADRCTVHRALGLSALLFLALGIAFFGNPAGLQMTLDQFGQWLVGWSLLRGAPWYRNGQLLLLYEPLVLVLGAGWLALRAVRRETPDEGARQDGSVALLAYAFLFMLGFSILPGYRPVNSVLLVLLPLCLAAGRAVEELWAGWQASFRDAWFWALLAVSGVLCYAALVELMLYMGLPASAYLLRIAALVVLLVSAHAMLWSWKGSGAALRAAAFTLSGLLLLLTLRSGLQLNYARARDPMEPLVGVTTSPDVLTLARDARKLSSRLTGDPLSLDWRVDASLRVPLGWYLRDWDQVEFVTSVPSDDSAGALILRAEATPPARYLGLRFRLHAGAPVAWLAPDEWLRWWADYRPAVRARSVDEVILWVRSQEQQ